MEDYRFIDSKGTFSLKNPENVSGLYFPIAGEQGLKGSITPNLGGDLKTDQNHFVLQPVSIENLHNDKSTRNFWVRIQGKGTWSATGASAQAKSELFTSNQEDSELEAGIMCHRITRRSEAYQLSSNITSFIPAKGPAVEIMQVELRNDSLSDMTVTPTAAVPIYGRSADNIRDHRHVTSLLHRIHTNEFGVVVTPTLSFDERGHRKNTSAYYVCGVSGEGEKPAAFYPIAEDYIGEGGSYEQPEAVLKGLRGVPSGFSADGYEAMGGLVFDAVTLCPGENKIYTILIGMEPDGDEGTILSVIEQFDTEAKVKKELKKTKSYWDNALNVSFKTSDPSFDSLMYWVSFQPMLRRIYGCSFLPHHDYGKGGRGWRDLWQDCLALLMMNPDGVSAMLTDNFGGVRMDGTNATIIGSKQGEFIADRNNITRVWMDHGVWPLMTTRLYIDQTGDLSILLKERSYFKDRQTARGTATDPLFELTKGTEQLDANDRVYQGTILEHLLLQNLTPFYEVGEHNHIRLRGADWNDALDMAPERGESVAFTAAYADNLQVLADLISELRDSCGLESIVTARELEILFADSKDLYDSIRGKNNLLSDYCASCFHSISGEKIAIPIDTAITSLHNKSEWVKNHIRETEWIADEKNDCGWFNGYYDNNGRRVEGVFPKESRMMLTSQVFTVMSGTAGGDQVRSIAAAADRYLYEKDAGGYKLNTDFHEIKTDLGRMFGFAYGHKENGAVFSHMTTMYANALYKRGFVKEGYKAIKTLYDQALNFPLSRIYPGIPEYFSSKGRGLYHYLTGAASWMMITVISGMFGVKGREGNLLFEPKLMPEQFDGNGRAVISLVFRNRKLKIVYVNEQGLPYGEYSAAVLSVDGKKTSGYNVSELSISELQELDENTEHEVIIGLI